MLPHDLIKNQFDDLIENTFRREEVLYLACNIEQAFFASEEHENILLDIDNIHFEQMVHRIYHPELQLNKANASDTETAFLDLNLSIHNDILSTKIYDKRDDFDIVNFRSLMAMFLDVPLLVYIYLNFFDLPEHLRMLLTSIIVTNS